MANRSDGKKAPPLPPLPPFFNLFPTPAPCAATSQMDHHCPWVNNCVGIGNHKFFIQFISYVFSIAVYALGLVFCRFVSCVSETSGCDDPSTNLLVVLLVVEVSGLVDCTNMAV